MNDNMIDEQGDKRFDLFLQQQLQSASPYLDDGDFSARVMAGLPASKHLSSWLEKLIVTVPVTAIAFWVLSQLPVRTLIQSVYGWVITFDMASLSSVAIGMLACTLIIPLSLVFKRSSLF